MTRQSPSLHGVAWVTPPASSVLCAAKTAADPSRFALVVPRLRGTIVHPVIRSRPGLMLPDRAWSLFSGAPARRISMETSSSPRFLGDPRVCLPCSSTPARPRRLAIAAPRCCPRSILRRRPRQVPHFRSSITQLSHSLSTLRSPGHPDTTQDSLPAGGYPLPDGIRTPIGSLCEVSTMSTSIASPSPRLRLAQRMFEERGVGSSPV